MVAQLVENGAIASYLYNPSDGSFLSADRSLTLSDAALRGFAGTPGQEVTYTAWPPGSGPRVVSSSVPVRRRLPPR